MENFSNRNITVVLLNLGGPDSLKAVEPFLFHLFSDPDIISLPGGKILPTFLARFMARKRARKAQEIYKKIGGKSPIQDITREQARVLEKSFNSSTQIRVRVAMRYWYPFIEETLLQIPRDHQVILLPLYPQYSSTTTGSSFNEVYRVIKNHHLDAKRLIFIDHYYNHPRFIQSWVEVIRKQLSTNISLLDKEVAILFSAHGIPQKLVKKGDPYPYQIEETVKLIMHELGYQNSFRIAYQSKVGPMRWLEPSVSQAIEDLAQTGYKSVIVVPISFVSEHSETLYELDILLKEKAKTLGIENYIRVPALNVHTSFIQALKEVVTKYVYQT